jgi:hypothetical protein
MERSNSNAENSGSLSTLGRFVSKNRGILLASTLPLLAAWQPKIKAEPDKDSSKCVATGEFNVSEKRDHLLMETTCGADDIAPRIKDKSVYLIPFRNAAVSIMKEDANDPVFRLHYKDSADEAYHIVPLPKRPDEAYEYSFEDLVPDKVEPIERQ